MFFRLDEIVLPLAAVFVSFPASAAACAEVAVVRIAGEFCGIADFSAGGETETGEISVVDGEICRKAEKGADADAAAFGKDDASV